DTLAAAMVRAAREALKGVPDIWHLHNHSLGKNTALPGAVLRLARDGQHLLLQPHDFAEDGRPLLYARLRRDLADGDVGRLSALLYPLAPQIHYAALNRRDRDFLAAAGVPQAQLHTLPNAVSLGPAPDSGSAEHGHAQQRRADGQRLWLYPTRAIRRKNLGELLLWAALAGEEDRFATTQAPQNPQEVPAYRRWVALSAELGLRMAFEVGAGGRPFPALVADSHALVTTSIAEGFGLAFLEPWLLGRPLAGRDLPEITADFTATGVQLPGLYDRLLVPLEWLDSSRLRSVFETAATQRAAAFGWAVADAAERAWQHVLHDDMIDFGRLDEPAQEEVIRRLRHDPAARGELRPQALTVSADAALIDQNRAIIAAHYSVQGYGEHLAAIYAAVAAAPPSPTFAAADGAALLARFLAPERLWLLRS
ncbi:hypothetical protein, partial [Thiohalocapsa sp.]|uniref:hypothetical protein n=1 Tax=Thiohalocapsa sp. TaxID=2497641 RepID=UPI0025CBA1EB